MRDRDSGTTDSMAQREGHCLSPAVANTTGKHLWRRDLDKGATCLRCQIKLTKDEFQRAIGNGLTATWKIAP